MLIFYAGVSLKQAKKFCAGGPVFFEGQTATGARG